MEKYLNTVKIPVQADTHRFKRWISITPDATEDDQISYLAWEVERAICSHLKIKRKFEILWEDGFKAINKGLKPEDFAKVVELL